MYWLRAVNLSGPLVWLILCSGWWLGGWLIASHAFQLKSGHQPIAGFGLGLAGYLWAAGALLNWTSPGLAFPLAVLPVGLLGLALARRRSGPLLSFPGRGGLILLAAGLLLAGFFTRIGKGLGDTQDLEMLPVISTLAAGRLPPTTALLGARQTPSSDGFQVLGAGLVRTGGLFPWSALDLSNGLIWGLGILLAFLAARQASSHPLAAPLTAAILVFASGTRYLLLLLPPGTLDEIKVQLISPAGFTMGFTPLSEALTGSWAAPGGPPLAYPVAFLDGALPPYAALHAGAGGLSLVMLLLLWVLAPRADHPLAYLPLALAFALWGATFGAVYLAGLLAWLPLLWRWRRGLPIPALRQATRGLALSLPLVLLWHGFPASGFEFRWPPTLPAAPFAPLVLDSGEALLIAAFEAGPILLFAPALTRRAWEDAGLEGWFQAFLATFGWVALALSLFLQFTNPEVNGVLVRHALLAWTLLLALGLWEHAREPRSRGPIAGAVALGLMVLGGMVLAVFHLSAGSQAVLSAGIDGLDARIARDVWGGLPGPGRVLDAEPGRAATLTGLPAGYPPDELPAPEELLRQGSRYIYVDETWWTGLSGEERAALSGPCVRVLSEHRGPDGAAFRRLLDLGACGPASGSPFPQVGQSAVR